MPLITKTKAALEPNPDINTEGAFALAMLEEALSNTTICAVLFETAARLYETIFPAIEEAVLTADEGPLPERAQVFRNYSMQHSSGDAAIGALLPQCSQADLELTKLGRAQLLTAMKRRLLDVDIKTSHDFLSLVKTLDGIAYGYRSALFEGRRSADYGLIESFIAPTKEEVNIRALRPEPLVSISYGIGTERSRDLIHKEDPSSLEKRGSLSGKARFFITPQTGRPITWFEKMARRAEQESLPLIASVSNTTASLLITAHSIDLFKRADGLFDLDKAQILANCIMAYLVYCGHHSVLEVIEPYNRHLDFLVIERPMQLLEGIIPAEPTELPYFVEPNAVERRLLYGRVGEYASFLHASYAADVMTRMECHLSTELDLGFPSMRSY